MGGEGAFTAGLPDSSWYGNRSRVWQVRRLRLGTDLVPIPWVTLGEAMTSLGPSVLLYLRGLG